MAGCLLDVEGSALSCMGGAEPTVLVLVLSQEKRELIAEGASRRGTFLESLVPQGGVSWFWLWLTKTPSLVRPE